MVSANFVVPEEAIQWTRAGLTRSVRMTNRLEISSSPNCVPMPFLGYECLHELSAQAGIELIDHCDVQDWAYRARSPLPIGIKREFHECWTAH